MISQVYSVLDTKADAFAPPFFVHRDEVAVRAFRDAVLDPQHPMSRHPEDYKLYRIGTFSDSDARLTPEVPVFICNANGEPENG